MRYPATKHLPLATATCLLFVSISAAQAPKQTPAGYFKDAPGFAVFLAPYPAVGSKQDEIDVAAFREWQVDDGSPRWKLAQSDAAHLSYDRFSEALGMDVSREKLPVLIHLLNGVEEDIDKATVDAKRYFHRPRPYQRLQVAHICGAAKPPDPSPAPTTGNSYPSGHTTFGWSTALILAEVAPDRAAAILARGREYGESRIVCAVHYPSDVAAGQILATGIVERLHVVPEFMSDLACAKQEYDAAQRKGPLTPVCRQREAEVRGTEAGAR